MRATTTLLPFLPALAAAVPNVTVVPLNSKGCSAWPGYIRTPDADATGYLRFEVASADDPAIDGLLGTSHTQNWPIPSNYSNTVQTLVVDVRKSTRIAKPVFRCLDGELHMNSPTNPAITVSKDNRGAWMMLGEYADGPGYKLDVYAHEIDGVRQPGVFLGAEGRTTWGFNWERPSTEDCTNGNAGLDWYTARVQGLEYDPSVPSRAWRDAEFEGFLRVFEI